MTNGVIAQRWYFRRWFNRLRSFETLPNRWSHFRDLRCKTNQAAAALDVQIPPTKRAKPNSEEGSCTRLVALSIVFVVQFKSLTRGGVIIRRFVLTDSAASSKQGQRRTLRETSSSQKCSDLWIENDEKLVRFGTLSCRGNCTILVCETEFYGLVSKCVEIWRELSFVLTFSQRLRYQIVSNYWQ